MISENLGTVKSYFILSSISGFIDGNSRTVVEHYRNKRTKHKSLLIFTHAGEITQMDQKLDKMPSLRNDQAVTVPTPSWQRYPTIIFMPPAAIIPVKPIKLIFAISFNGVGCFPLPPT